MADKKKTSVEGRKVYMPKNEELRIKIIWLYHNVLVVKHERR